MKLNEGRFQKCAIVLMNVQPPTSFSNETLSLSTTKCCYLTFF